MKFLGNVEFKNKNNKPKTIEIKKWDSKGNLKKHVIKTYFEEVK